MSRLSDAFPRGRTGLVCYAMGGDPTLAATEELLRAIEHLQEVPGQAEARHVRAGLDPVPRQHLAGLLVGQQHPGST